MPRTTMCGGAARRPRPTRPLQRGITKCRKGSRRCRGGWSTFDIEAVRDGADAVGSGCPICDKHRGIGALVGPVIYADDLVLVTHRPLTEGTPVPGYLFVETRRHAPTLSTLTDAEARAVGWAARRAAHALNVELAPEFVFSAITGRSVAHFHQHVFARPHGTPESVPWTNADTWRDAPHIDASALGELCDRLAIHFVIEH